MTGFGRLVRLHPTTSGLDLLWTYISTAIVIFALQLFWFPGIFIMALGGPLWIGMLIIAAMLHFGWLSIRRKISLTWAILPAMYFAVGYGVHIYSVQAAQAAAARIETKNAAIRITVDKPFKAVARGSAAMTLLDLARYYDAEIKEAYDVRTARGWRYSIHADYTTDWSVRQNWPFRQFGMKFEILDELNMETLGTLEVATFMPLLPIPLVLLGCGLSEGKGWHCDWGLGFSSAALTAGYSPGALERRSRLDAWRYRTGEDTEVALLAKVLGLSPR